MTKQINKYMRLVKYFNEYPDIFNEYEKSYILDSAYDEDLIYYYEVIREVYDELGLIPEDKNIYDAFTNIIDNKFNIKDKNIIEIGGGHLPRLAKRITDIQDKGTIRVYDPALSKYEESNSKFVLVRDRFDKNVDLTDTDLLIGLMPCGAAGEIVDTATDNNIDFIVALCEGGPHGEEYDYFEDEDEWLNSICETADYKVKKSNMGTLVKEKSLVKYKDNYPVIYNKR